jgi:hypothetical protein
LRLSIFKGDESFPPSIFPSELTVLQKISWAKIATTAGQALPWNININTGDWVISK